MDRRDTDAGAVPADGANNDIDGAAEAALLELITGSWKSQAIRAAAELGIAELLIAAPMTSAQVAVAAHLHPPFVHQLLRALTTVGVVEETEEGAFALTSTGALLPSLRSWSTWWGQYAWVEWAALVDSLRTGTSARSLLAGTPGFAGIEADPEAAGVFNSAMAELTALEVRGLMRAYDFSAFGTIVDVGGGYGEAMVAILTACPGSTGAVYDLAHAADGGRRRVEEAGLAARCDIVTGDFFESVPAGADAYLLKSVLHDWTDADAERILVSCRRAMGHDSTLILVERMMPDRLTVSSAHQSLARCDLHMLVAHGARERTAVEFGALLAAGGFRQTHVAGAAGGLDIIEALPAF